MRFSTQMLLLQLACVIAVVAICTGVFVWIGVQQLRAEAETSALSIARTVAADADVRAGVATISAQAGTPSNADLRGGPLALLAADTEQNTGALFIVITDDHGIRLAHPDPQLLGRVVSTSFTEALAGRESVAWESGTLGESARAKVPVRDPQTDEPVGEVSVGFAPASVFQELPLLLGGVALAAIFAVALGAVVSLVLRRRLERLTLGLQPEELAGLVQNQAAVLDGVGDGVLAYGPDGVVTVANTTAARLLGTPDLVGRGIRDLDLPAPVLAALSRHAGDGPRPIGCRRAALGRRPRRLHRHSSGIARRSRSGAHRRDPRPHRRRHTHRSARDRRLDDRRAASAATRVREPPARDGRPDRCGPRARRTRLSRRSARGIARGRDRAG